MLLLILAPDGAEQKSLILLRSIEFQPYTLSVKPNRHSLNSHGLSLEKKGKDEQAHSANFRFHSNSTDKEDMKKNKWGGMRSRYTISFWWESQLRSLQGCTIGIVTFDM